MRIPEPTAITSTSVIGPTNSNSIHFILSVRSSHGRREIRRATKGAKMTTGRLIFVVGAGFVLSAALSMLPGCGRSSANKALTVAMMPKSKGNAYFIACRKGAEEAARELGIELIWDGPTDPDPAKQSEIVDTWITRGVDVIAVAVENRAGISSVLRKARQRGIQVINAHPDVQLIMSICSPAVPCAAEAVKQSRRTDVKVIGLGLPNDNKPYVHAGITDAVVLWNTMDLGYLTIYAAKAVHEGRLKAGDTSLSAGRLRKVEVAGDNILLGQPLTFTKANIDQFDF